MSFFFLNGSPALDWTGQKRKLWYALTKKVKKEKKKKHSQHALGLNLFKEN